MSLSAMPNALARVMSRAALVARSLCEAAAVGFKDSTPTIRNAVSGFADTLASPLAKTPGVKLAVDCGNAAGDATTTWGRLPATTASATATAHTAATAPENNAGRTRGAISFKSMKRKLPLRPVGNKHAH